MRIRCLSIVAPAGAMIAKGRKTIEVRSWKPQPLPLSPLLIVENSRYLHDPGDFDEDGVAVAIVRIESVHEWCVDEVEAACATQWEAGYYAWEISRVRAITKRICVPAHRKIYTVEIGDDLLPDFTV